jgi:hypothetical protein
VKNVFLICALVPALAFAQTTPAPTPPADAPTTPPADGSSTAPAATTTGTADPAAAAAKPKNALANAVQARTPEEQAKQSGFQIGVSLDHYLGTGTFVDPELYSSLMAYLTLSGQYQFGIGKQRFAASVNLRGFYEYTLPDSPTGRRWGTGDIRFGLAAPALFREKVTGISFTPSIGLTLPTSLESWNAGLIFAASGGVTMSRSIEMFDFRAGINGSLAAYPQAFSGYRNPTLNGAPVPTDSHGVAVVTCRPTELYCASAGSNPFASFSAFGQVQWRVGGNLLFYAQYQFIHSWRRGVTDVVDEYTPKALDSNGNSVADVGAGQRDSVATVLGGSYQLNEHYSIDLGIYTGPVTPLMINKETGVKSVRFPFLSFGNWADNATSIYFTLSAFY